jgi:hypothetical protein
VQLLKGLIVMKTKLACSSILLFAAACGGGSGAANDLDAQQSAEAWTALQSAVGQGGGLSNESQTAECLEGGTVGVSNINVSIEGEDVYVSGNMNFSSCGANGIVMDGAVGFSVSVTGEVVTSDYHGAVYFSGDIVGSCDFDLSMSVGQATEVHGSLCGHNIDVFVGI